MFNDLERQRGARQRRARARRLDGQPRSTARPDRRHHHDRLATATYSFTGVGPGTYTIEEVQQSGYTATTPDLDRRDATSGLRRRRPTTSASSRSRHPQRRGVQRPQRQRRARRRRAGPRRLDRQPARTAPARSSPPPRPTPTATTRSPASAPAPTPSRRCSSRATSRPSPPSGTYTETLGSGQSVANLNFGDFQTVTFSGEVFNDLNGNGTLDGGEPGLAGWTVNLLNSSNQVVATATTDSQRRLLVHRRRPGDLHGPGSAAVRLRPVQPAGDLQRDGHQRPERRRPELRRVPDRHARRRGLQRPQRQRHARRRRARASPGWTVNLLNSSDQVIAATTTDSNGDYSFTGVGPGTYTIAGGPAVRLSSPPRPPPTP